jgi:hypothetical protein
VEDSTSRGTTHDLLLALAGRVDDDLLRWARELVALGEDARAVEMLTASMVAARVVLPPQVHSALVAVAHSTRTDLGPAASLPQPRPEDGTEHRFAPPGGHDPVAGAVLDFPARPLTGCSVLLARRLTPAGSAPGPLPHPVVLVRVHDRTRHAEVLAYQLGAALERAGAPASVEVLPADGPVPDYHAAALDAAVQLRQELGDEQPWRPSPRADAVRTGPPSQPLPAPPVERHALAPPVDRPAPRHVPEPHPLAAGPPPAPVSRFPAPPRERQNPAPPPVAEPMVPAGVQPSAEPDLESSESATARLTPEPGHRFGVADRHDEDDIAADVASDENASDENASDEGASDDEVEVADDRFHDEEYDREDEQDEDEAGPVEAEESFPDPPSPHPLAAPRPSRPTPLPPATVLSPRGTRPHHTVTPISRAAQNPIPLVRRNGLTPVPPPIPVTDPRPTLRPVDNHDDRDDRDDRDGIAPPVDERPDRAAEEPQPPRRETPAFESLSDPLSGPLHQPLLAPLLDPTRAEDDPLGRPGRRPEAQRPAPAAPPDDDEWSSEWLSGTWAMAPSAFTEPTEPEPEPEDDQHTDVGRPAPRPVPRTPARHRFADEPAPDRSVAPERPVQDDVPADDEAEARPDAGQQRPDSASRLSDADRQLLARLQAELLDGHRQRLGRRITNGSHHGSGPDFGG